MTKLDLLDVALKLFGLYFLFQSLLIILALIYDQPFSNPVLRAILIRLVVGLILVFKSKSLANLITRYSN